MKMIKIDSENVIAADMIGGLRCGDSHNGVTVILKDGRSLWIYNDYGKSSYQTMARLEQEINEALK